MTNDWETPLGGFIEVADAKAATEWILAEAGRRKRRITGYTRAILKPERKVRVVDFGDYSMFGLVQFDTAEETMATPPLPETDRDARESPAATAVYVLHTLPATAHQLEVALHSMCDEGRWDWTVDALNGSLVLKESK